MESNIFLLSLLTAASIAGKGGPAAKSWDAYARYTGMDSQINDVTKKFQTSAESSMPEESKIYLFSGYYVGKIIVEKKIVLTWRFP